MRKIYHLSTCSTCQRILKNVIGAAEIEKQDIKVDKITSAQLQEMKELAGSHEALFSRRAQKYRKLGLHEKELSEEDYRDLILEEYTFLKRPVTILDDRIFIGNTKNTLADLAEALNV